MSMSCAIFISTFSSVRMCAQFYPLHPSILFIKAENCEWLFIQFRVVPIIGLVIGKDREFCDNRYWWISNVATLAHYLEVFACIVIYTK